ncbi:hypothetical protein Tco_1211196 [Tanacetum coccineum]
MYQSEDSAATAAPASFRRTPVEDYSIHPKCFKISAKAHEAYLYLRVGESTREGNDLNNEMKESEDASCNQKMILIRIDVLPITLREEEINSSDKIRQFSANNFHVTSIPTFVWNDFRVALLKLIPHWNLVSLMGYSKPNIKYDWKPTTMHATFMADIESSQVTWHLMCLLVGSYKSIMPVAFMGYYCFMVEVYVLITSVFFTPKAWDVGPGGNDLGPAI